MSERKERISLYIPGFTANVPITTTCTVQVKISLQPSLQIMKTVLLILRNCDSDTTEEWKTKKKKTILGPSQNKKPQSTENKGGNKEKESTALHFFFINKQRFLPKSQIAIYYKLGADFFNWPSCCFKRWSATLIYHCSLRRWQQKKKKREKQETDTDWLSQKKRMNKINRKS